MYLCSTCIVLCLSMTSEVTPISSHHFYLHYRVTDVVFYILHFTSTVSLAVALPVNLFILEFTLCSAAETLD